MTLGWLLLIFAGAIALFILGSNAYFQAIARRVRAKLDEITAIYESGLPPWREDDARDMVDAARLKRLIRYLKRTRLTVDAETKEEVLERLNESLEGWMQQAMQNKTDSD